MKQQNLCQSQSPLSLKKRELITINSLNKSIINNDVAKSKTLEHSLRYQGQNSLNASAIHQNSIPTNVINVELGRQLFKSISKKIRQSQDFKRQSQDFKRYFEKSLSKSKSRFGIGSEDKHRDQRKGVGRISNKVKYSSVQQRTQMKKYIRIQKIQLPAPVKQMKTTVQAVMTTVQTESYQQLQNLQVKNQICSSFTKYIENQKEINSPKIKSKLHKRNYSSIISKRIMPVSEDSMNGNLEKGKRGRYEDYQIRRPLGRKDYFVFGMSDRNNPDNKLQYFRDFLWKLNFSNSLHVQTPHQVGSLYKAYIGPGNNYHLIKGVLKRRFWWSIVDRPENSQGWENLNFVWMQLKQNQFFCLQNKQKDPLKQPTQNDQQQTFKQKRSFNDYPILEDGHQKIFSKRDQQKWSQHLIKNQKTEEKINENTYIKRMNLLYDKNMTNITNSNKLKVQNHLQSNFYIGNKKALFYNMRKYLSLKGVHPFTVIPLTFHISKGVQDPQFKTFKMHYQQIEQDKGVNGLRNIWIVKPGENTNRGNGISVAYSIDDVVMRIRGRQRNSDGKLRTFIVQKYIEKPLLYCKRKFDIRHYMLITCINGIFKGYWYEEGYIRTSSSEFTTKYSKDLFMHLTNDAIQKNGANYGKFQKGNKLSYQDFQRYLECSYKKQRINFFEDILPKMKQISQQSVKATYQLLDEKKLEHNFELLGLDFMIDQNFKPWLIQVNTNPCLQLSCSLLQKIIPQLIDNVFRICVDPLFPPPQNWQYGKRMYFGQNPLTQNKFSIIFDEMEDGYEIEKLYKGSSIVDQKMGKIQEDDETFQNDGEEDWEAVK